MWSFLKQTLIRISPHAWEIRLRLLREKLAGVDFSTTLQPEDVGLNPLIVNRSSPSGNRFLRDVLRQLAISNQDQIVDIGCGKGSAMRVMLDFPFARVDGVELSEQIVSIARRNFQRLQVAPERCTIFATDATRFEEINLYNYIYLYNPFPCQIMAQFMEVLSKSIHQNPRRLTVIYNNAICHDIVIKTGLLSRVCEYPDEWGNKIAIYTNDLPKRIL